MSVTSEFPLYRHSIAGHPVDFLAKEFGTPTFFYDASMIRRRYEQLKAFDVVRFAQKACSNLAIVDLLRQCGAAVDAVSGMEVRRALAAGYSPQGDPPPVVFTADIFDADALEVVLEHDVHVNCGSIDMIRQLGERRPGSEITLRVNPGFGHGHSRKTNTGGPQSKHGIWHAWLPECVKVAKEFDMTITGLHMHIGSGTDMEHLGHCCGAMEQFARTVGPSVRSISAGGGIPVPYTPEETRPDLNAYFDLWDNSRKMLESDFGHPVSLEVEPGRYLTAESGFLLTEIRAVKFQEENRFYLVDAGFNNVARPILYGAYHPISIAPKAPKPPKESPEASEERTQEVIVGGPLCESGDIFTQEEGGFVVHRTLPVADVGDYLILERTGAYGSVMGSNYNSKTMAAEVLLDGEQVHCIRRRQTFEQLIENETIPTETARSE